MGASSNQLAILHDNKHTADLLCKQKCDMQSTDWTAIKSAPAVATFLSFPSATLLPIPTTLHDGEASDLVTNYGKLRKREFAVH